MISRLVLLATGVWLLAGCGRNPTVRHYPTEGQDGDSPAASSRASKNSPSTPEEMPGAFTPTPKSKGRPRPKLADVPSSLAAAPAEAASESKADANAPSDTGETAPPAGASTAAPTREVRFGGLRMVAPDAWNPGKRAAKLLLAEFTLPRSKGDSSDAQLTVTQPVKDDKEGQARLRDQIKQEEESKESKVERLTLGGREVVLVDSSEEDSDSKERRQRSLNAMVFVGSSVYFVNCSGPEKTVTERLGEFRAFLETMQTE